MKRYWLVTTSYQRAGVHAYRVVCNNVTQAHPAVFLRRLIDEWPDLGYRLLFAIEIDEEQYLALDGLVG